MSDNEPSAAEQPPETGEQALGRHLTASATWIRFLFMCLSVALLWVAGIVGCLVVVLGFLWVLVTGDVNAELRRVGQSLARYVEQIIRYLTYNSEERPFPLGGEWPAASD
ncbi:MAG: DUF4389 domain-containing protein [Woeseiaceae bacterium]|nr:DUF4389 domain-containing protein [Woeseiaceae bacterium]